MPRAITLVRALLELSPMHPALHPYLDPKPVRTWRYLLAGGFAGLMGFKLAVLVGGLL